MPTTFAVALTAAALLLGSDAPETPKSLRTDFVFTDGAPFPSCHACTLLEAKPGEWLCSYFAGDREGAPNVAIWISYGRSQKDGAVVWDDPQVAHREPNVPCFNPVLCRTGPKELILFFKAGPNPQSWTGFVKRSTDDGVTWSPAELLPAGILGPIRAKPLQLADGTLVCGSSVESYRTWAVWVERTKDAKTWTKHGPVTIPGFEPGIIQPTVFPAADGSLVMLCRSRGLGKVARATSP
ncbi:MAG: exo-alpha-sialidase, partial [Planctomycetia bacterium]